MYHQFNLEHQRSLLNRLDFKTLDDIHEFGENFHGLLHINEKQTHKMSYLNTVGLRTTGADQKELIVDTMKVLKKNIHPANITFNRQLIHNWEQKEDPNTLVFFQHIKTLKTGYHEWFISFKKHLNNQENFTLTVPLNQVRDLEKMIHPYTNMHFGYGDRRK